MVGNIIEISTILMVDPSYVEDSEQASRWSIDKLPRIPGGINITLLIEAHKRLETQQFRLSAPTFLLNCMNFFNNLLMKLFTKIFFLFFFLWLLFAVHLKRILSVLTRSLMINDFNYD